MTAIERAREALTTPDANEDLALVCLRLIKQEMPRGFAATVALLEVRTDVDPEARERLRERLDQLAGEG